MSGGSLSRLGTELNGISGGCCCANADGLNSMRAPTSHGFMGSSLVFCLRCPTLEHFSQKWNSVRARKCDRAETQNVAGGRCFPADVNRSHHPRSVQSGGLGGQSGADRMRDGCGPARPVVRRRRWVCAGWWWRRSSWCWRGRRRAPTRWRISTRARWSPWWSGTGRAAATTSMGGWSPPTSANTSRAIRPSWFRTCRGPAACARSIISTTPRPRTAPSSPPSRATCRSWGSSATIPMCGSIRASSPGSAPRRATATTPICCSPARMRR